MIKKIKTIKYAVYGKNRTKVSEHDSYKEAVKADKELKLSNPVSKPKTKKKVLKTSKSHK